jgi:hypothetical protein
MTKAVLAGIGVLTFPSASTLTPVHAWELELGAIPCSTNVHPAAWKICSSFLANLYGL